MCAFPLPPTASRCSPPLPKSRTGPLPEDHFKLLTMALKVRRDLTLLPDSLTPSAPSLVPWPLLHLPSLCLPQGLGTGSSRISSRSLLSLRPHSPPAGAQISLPRALPNHPPAVAAPTCSSPSSKCSLPSFSALSAPFVSLFTMVFVGYQFHWAVIHKPHNSPRQEYNSVVFLHPPRCVTITTLSFRTFLSPPPRNSIPISGHSHFPRCPHPLATNSLSVS